MKFRKLNTATYAIRLEKGEEIIATLSAFCRQNDISSGYFTAIGSIENPTLAHYMVSTKQYTEKKLEGIYEITSQIGNIAIFENNPLIHTHASLSNDHMQAFGGHVVSATVSATLEVFLTVYEGELGKKMSDEIGLKLWDF